MLIQTPMMTVFCSVVIQKSEWNELINDIRNKFNWDPY